MFPNVPKFPKLFAHLSVLPSVSLSLIGISHGFLLLIVALFPFEFRLRLPAIRLVSAALLRGVRIAENRYFEISK